MNNGLTNLNITLETGVNNEAANRSEVELEGIIHERNGDFWSGTFRPDYLFGPDYDPEQVAPAGHDDDNDGRGRFGGGADAANPYRAPEYSRKRQSDLEPGSSGLMPSRKIRR